MREIFVARQGNVYAPKRYIDEEQILGYLQSKNLNYRKRGGGQITIQRCPYCHAIKNKTDEHALNITLQTGAFFCHRCGVQGHWNDFRTGLGDPAEITNWSGKPIANMPKPKPKQEIASRYPKHFDLFGNEPYEYLTKKRGLKPDTIEKYQVGMAAQKFEDGTGMWIDEPCFTFPWIENSSTGGQIVRVKHRSFLNKGNMRLEPKGGSWGLFGLHMVPAESTEIILTEGEFDAMSVYQETGIPAVSLPNGANSMPAELVGKLERFKKILLWMDDDHKGQQGAEKIAERLGIHRCLIVKTKHGNENGPKDANEAMLAGEDFMQIISSAKPIQHKDVLSFSDLRAQIYAEFKNPEQTMGTPCLCLPSYNKIVKGLRDEELTIWTGATGVGKTTVLSQISTDYAKQGVPTMWGSFEINNTKLGKTMLSQYANMDFVSNLKLFDHYADKFESVPMFFMKFFGSTPLETLLQVMNYGVHAQDIKHFVLDNLQFMTSGQGMSKDMFAIQDHVIQSLRGFATDAKVHISLVIHPRKHVDGQPLGINDIFGGGKATQEADNVVILQKVGLPQAPPETMDLYIDVKKNRYDGDTGQVKYAFDKTTRSIRELTDNENHARELVQSKGFRRASKRIQDENGFKRKGRDAQFKD